MDSPRFRFALIADTHVNAADNETSSPWEVNRRANQRAGNVFRRIAEESPDFTVHLGDMVHPVPGTSGYPIAAERFRSLAAVTETPLHLVPGNHDAGDKPLRWTPASPISESALEAYSGEFGASYYSFDHDDIHFVVINSMLIGSGLSADEPQQRWLEEDLRQAHGRRIFVFGHYPPYLLDPDEPECYDNLAEPGRRWLLALFEAHQVEAAFFGHVHNFFYNRYHDTDQYVLPSTAFVRHDYSELARVAPAEQFGRDDATKLGYAIVEIYPDHHQLHVVRAELADDSGPTRRASLRDTAAGHVGMDLRSGWAERLSLPYNGMLDEFTRRIVRNDYPLLALWECGIADLRIPVTDLLDAGMLQRLGELSARGHRFHVFSYDIPHDRADLPLRAVLTEVAPLLAGVEIIQPAESFDADALAALRDELGCPVAISPLVTSADSSHDAQADTRFAHQVRHGFAAEADLPELGCDGVTFRVNAEQSAWQQIPLARANAADHGYRALIHVTLAGPDPATDPDNQAATCARVAETLVAGWALPDAQVFLDTLVDVDRGYFPRRGLVDRRFNPGPAGIVYRHLHTVLAELGRPGGGVGEGLQVAGGRICPADDGRVLLVLPDPEAADSEVSPAAVAELTGGRPVTVVDLMTGARQTTATPGRQSYRTPTLVTVDPALELVP